MIMFQWTVWDAMWPMVPVMVIFVSDMALQLLGDAPISEASPGQDRHWVASLISAHDAQLLWHT